MSRRHSPAAGAVRAVFIAAGAALLALLPGAAAAYPLDDAEGTGIGRLEAARRIEAGTLQGTRQPPGALLDTAQVQLRLLAQPRFELPTPDADFTAAAVRLLGDKRDRYSLALLDLSDPAKPYYAEHRAGERYNPGSVGKLLVAVAWLQLLADRYPDDPAARWRLLRETEIAADDVIISDSHTVKRWDRDAERLIVRPLQVGDRGTLFEYLDWMISPSSNAAASVLIRQAMLFSHFGADYPLANEAAAAFFRNTPRAELEKLIARVLLEPVTRNGFDVDSLRQSSLFTRRGKALVSGTTSVATPRALMELLVRMEQGRIVDAPSSLLLKRLMYQTERRIRYGSSPALSGAALYFKSGSLFQCAPEPDFVCKAYAGNVKNLMHSVAIVEAPAAERRLYYLVVVMSNVLRKNSAVDHQSLGTAIHRLIESRHPVATSPAPAAPAAE